MTAISCSPARGRYGVASTEGGNATVYGIATEDTRVTLAQPRLVLQRKPGNKLHFAIRVPGGDEHVRVAIKLGNKTLAQGYATQTGRFFKTIVKPSAQGQPARSRVRARRRHGVLGAEDPQPVTACCEPARDGAASCEAAPSAFGTRPCERCEAMRTLAPCPAERPSIHAHLRNLR